MRIIELIPTIASGGGEKFVVDLSNELSIQGHDVSLITLFDYNDSFIFEKIGLSKIDTAFAKFLVPGTVKGKILIDSEA